jgi:hypothetical protein
MRRVRSSPAAGGTKRTARPELADPEGLAECRWHSIGTPKTIIFFGKIVGIEMFYFLSHDIT